jgi:hypothetical protein
MKLVAGFRIAGHQDVDRIQHTFQIQLAITSGPTTRAKDFLCGKTPNLGCGDLARTRFRSEHGDMRCCFRAATETESI